MDIVHMEMGIKLRCGAKIYVGTYARLNAYFVDT